MVVMLLYATAARIGLSYAVVGSTVTLVWAPSGIALAAVLLYGRSMFLAVALGAVAANVGAGLPWWAVCSIAMGNLLEVGVGFGLLRHVAGFPHRLETRRDVFALIACAAVVSTMFSAVVGVSTLVGAGVVAWGDYAAVLLKWWLGDMMGVLVFTPILLSCAGPRRVLSAREVVEALSLVVALTLISLKIFGDADLARQGNFPVSLAVFPFVIWGALRFHMLGAGLVTLIVSVLAVWGTSQGTGPFATSDPAVSLMLWCTFAIVVAVTGLLLAASVEEQWAAQFALQRSHAELERQVNERTRALVGANTTLIQEMKARHALEIQLIRVSEEQRSEIGRELHDGLGQHLTSLSFLCGSLKHKLASSGHPEFVLTQRIEKMINEALHMARCVARGLYPVAMDHGGLPAALEQLADQTREQATMDCTVRIEPGMQVKNPLVAINLYRIAQEAVTNAAKYSHASHLRIHLGWEGENLSLTISDDGIGIDSLLASKSDGLGMHSMRFRANLLGGSMKIESHAREGTSIVVVCPDQQESTGLRHAA